MDKSLKLPLTVINSKLRRKGTTEKSHVNGIVSEVC